MATNWKKYSYTARKEARHNILIISFIIIAVFILYILITSYLITAYKVQADTMQPTFQSGDFILSSPLSKLGTIKRGELVLVVPQSDFEQSAFKKILNEIIGFVTFQYYRPMDPARTLANRTEIRRIIGMPGDSIYMEDFILHIKPNGQEHFLTEFEVTESNYNVKIENLPEGWTKDLPFSGSMQEIKLAQNEYFVLCDNRIASTDSRFWGAIDGKKAIKGKILLRYWPFNRFGRP